MSVELKFYGGRKPIKEKNCLKAPREVGAIKKKDLETFLCVLNHQLFYAAY